MASAVDRVQVRLQEAMDQGNQASLGQAIDASKGVNGLKQLRRSAKVHVQTNTNTAVHMYQQFKRVLCSARSQM